MKLRRRKLTGKAIYTNRSRKGAAQLKRMVTLGLPLGDYPLTAPERGRHN